MARVQWNTPHHLAMSLLASYPGPLCVRGEMLFRGLSENDGNDIGRFVGCILHSCLLQDQKHFGQHVPWSSALVLCLELETGTWAWSSNCEHLALSFDTTNWSGCAQNGCFSKIWPHVLDDSIDMLILIVQISWYVSAIPIMAVYKLIPHKGHAKAGEVKALSRSRGGLTGRYCCSYWKRHESRTWIPSGISDFNHHHPLPMHLNMPLSVIQNDRALMHSCWHSLGCQIVLESYCSIIDGACPKYLLC